MVSETTPLQRPIDYEDEEFSWFERLMIRIGSSKRLLWGLGLIIGLPIVCFLLVFLPSLAPPSADIPDLIKVGRLPVYLHPLIPPKDPKVAHYGTTNDNYNDPESPIKNVPNFEKWSLLDKDTKLFRRHFRKLETAASQRPAKRLILIGDVHGSLYELQKLLKHVRYDGGRYDHVVLLGDFLAKGKNSLGVLEYAIQNRIDCILGNHEWEVLKRYVQYHGLPSLGFNESKNEVSATEQYDLDEQMRIAKRLMPEHIDYISRCPLIKELGPVPRMTNKKQTKYASIPANGVAVHGGLVWSVEDLQDQDPEAVLTMRNLLPPDYTIPTENRHEMVDGKKSKPWTRFWTRRQHEVVANASVDAFVAGMKVYYGHDAKRGVTFREFSTGLDSGCVYGAQLSAEIIWSEVVSTKSEHRIVYRRMFTQVNC
ncbi:hypothetical protein KL930_005348 [Ogataea haglerorum]|nr:hypothetical protein KL931_002666 [Ogataea haglerorum]KAG7772454.1 hypothetical protein KL930_005348 [Ogataea haglerorum]KAG7773545.1 hypothetical protein KL922_005284 [Ogataea haglerorum]KAG7787462.1 hypothetical protein KL945_003121 [Ogataea haglerorum]KAG7789601.1 hypothetical protein KL910_002307 [Ogataea haglerorum]